VEHEVSAGGGGRLAGPRPWPGDPSLVAGEVAVGAGEWGELQH